MKKTDSRLLLKKIAAFFCSLFLSVAFLETAVRVHDHIKASKEEMVWMGQRGFLNVRSKNPHAVYEYKPNTTIDLFGTKVTTNAFGYRDYPYSLSKPPLTKRIAVLGDSIAFGFRVDLDQTYAKILEKNLNESLKEHFQVLNMGISGYNTGQEVALFETRGIQFEPDLVILNYSLNDKSLYADGGLGGYFIKTATPCHLFGLLQYKWLKYWEAHSDIGERQVIAGLDHLRELCQAKNIPVVVIVHPMFNDAWPKQQVKNDIEWVKDLSQKRGFYFLDLSPFFENRNSGAVSVDALHPNPLGHKITAEALEHFLKDQKLVS